MFSTIEVTKQAFYRSSTALSFAIVNLKPIVPGHVLVIPARPVARLADLRADELGCLMQSVQKVGNIVEKAYGAHGLTVACQDGPAAGQSVPHVHFHVIPRKLKGDAFSGEANDQIYPALEKNEGELSKELRAQGEGAGEAIKMDNEAREARSMEVMEKEAGWLAEFFRE